MVASTPSPVPKIRAGPALDIATDASRTDRPNGVTEPASARPITSSTRNFVARTTSGGRSSNCRRDVHCAISDAIDIHLHYTGRHESMGIRHESMGIRHESLRVDAIAPGVVTVR